MVARKNEDALLVSEEIMKKANKDLFVTNNLMFDTVINWLKENSEAFSDGLEILDYYHARSWDEKPLIQYNDSMDVAAFVVPGGSEGIYIDWMWHTGKPSDRPIRIGTLKTLEEGMDAYATMGQVAGLLTYASWRFINRNWEHIQEGSDVVG